MACDSTVILHFCTKYFTAWGENVVICGNTPALGDDNVELAYRATCSHVGQDLLWEASVPVPLSLRCVRFQFAVVREVQVVKWETFRHIVRIPPDLEDGSILEIKCDWVDSSHPGNVHNARAFMEIVLPHPPPVQGCLPPCGAVKKSEILVQFRALDFELQEDEAMCITGGTALLGNWQLQQVVWMTQTSLGCWESEMSIPASAFPVTYKYAVGRPERDLILEPGESRLIALPAVDEQPHVIAQHDGFIRREGRWRGAGVAVPLFSLRSRTSVGCGEFRDLVMMAKWCKKSGFAVLQLLPVSDTSVQGDWRDSYPYSSLCVFALHPIYLCLEDTIDGPLDSSLYKEIEAARNELDFQDVDYEKTFQIKMKIARKMYDSMGKSYMTTDTGYLEFAKKNQDWLKPYAVFCFLKDMFGTSEHWNWGVFSSPSKQMIERMAGDDQEWHHTIQFYCFLQYKLHCQLLRASCKAKEMGIVLKGDLPIGVDKRSVDTWLHPDLFRMDTSTGAPPDYFDPGGQNWGFPTYDWEAMSKDNYSWWRRRLAHMAQYFQAYRIDHILGFFRIWELPADTKTGLLGRFRPSLPYTRSELESNGLWDIDRLCEPYITEELLHSMVDDKELEAEVTERFFEKSVGNRYKFRERYASESALMALKSRPGLPEDSIAETEKTKKILVTLRQNVVLINDRDSPGQRFFPRFGLSQTSSYRELDSSWQLCLKRMHDESFYGLRSDAIWREQAYKTLPMMMHATDMLVCGEDLGMIPSCVHPIMEDLGIIGLRIQRMPSEQAHEFGNPETYGYLTVASPASHDTTTFRFWYEEDSSRRARFMDNMLNLDSPADDCCTKDVMLTVMNQHLQSPSILAIFPIQDLLYLSDNIPVRPPEEETINVPSNPEHYWRYRMHVTLEDIMDDDRLIGCIRSMIASSGRR